MNVVPALKISRFAQLTPGDLFVFEHDAGSCVGLKVVDPANDGDKFILLLGPLFPPGITIPTLMRPVATTVVSFEKQYVLQLPSQASGWVVDAPSREQHCILAATDGVYARANYSSQGYPLQWCYVNIETGSIHSSNFRHTMPSGSCAYAIEWKFITTESEPRVILAYPRS